MLSEMALKVISGSMLLPTRTTGNTFLIKITKEGEFGNKKITLFKCFQIIRCFFCN